MFHGIWDFEENTDAAGAAGVTRDISGNGNDLAFNVSGGTPRSTRQQFVRQGCRSYNSDSANRRLDCDTSTCDPSVFCPINVSFTIGCWLYPFDSVNERSTIATYFATAGYQLGWKQTVGSVGNLYFDFKRNSGASNYQLLDFSTLSAEQWYHHVGRYLYDGVTGTMNQVINGVVDPNTHTIGPISQCDASLFNIGTGFFSGTQTGYMDECFYAEGALDDFTVCRIAVCGIDGKGCSCDEVNPDDYDYAPLHSTFGGPINCDLPPCDANPQLLTTTSTSTSSTTSTSSSSTTSTSTSSTTTTTL